MRNIQNNNVYDLAIIGSGISGLSFAHYCSKDSKTKLIIIEKGSKAGGCFDTYTNNKFQIELAAHTCYNSYIHFISIIEDCGLLGHIKEREKVSFKIFKKNKIQKISKALSFFELFTSLPNIIYTKKDNLSVMQYYSKIMGKKNYQNLMKYAFNAVLSQDSQNFPANTLFKKRKKRRKDIFKSFLIQGGLSKLIQAIIKYNQLNIIYDSEVLKISKNDEIFNLSLSNDKNIFAKKICFTTPVQTTEKLLISTHSKTSKLLARINHSTIETICVVIKKDKTHVPLMTGLIPINQCFYSSVSSDVFKHESLRGFVFHFQPKLKKLNEKIDLICSILKIKKNDILFKVEKISTLPNLRLENKNIIEKIDSSIHEQSVFICGNYFDGLSIEDCVLRSLKEFKRFKSSNQAKNEVC